MTNLNKKTRERFQYFSIVLNVRGGQDIDWTSLEKADMIDKMSKLDFPTPSGLARLLRNFEGIYQKSSKDKSKTRKFKFEGFRGQLEQGSDNGRPHYNLAVKVTAKVYSSVMIRELSQALYSVKNCGSINVEPTHDVESLENYCEKVETRLTLPATLYYPASVNLGVSDFLEALDRDENLKKIHEHPRLYQRMIFALIQTKPERRTINFIFNPKGGLGKSLTADYLEANPEFNALLVPQLSSPDRWVSALICQMQEYKTLNGVWPSTVIVDLTRNEDNANVEYLYSTLENIKNGRLDSTFFGKFKRIRFTPPHILVFTNNVPNTKALTNNRFSLFALSNEDHNFTMVKCEVSLKIDHYSKSLITWSYKAKPSNDEIQLKFYKKIFSEAMTALAMASLSNANHHIKEQTFLGDKRTKTHSNAPEPVQEMLNFILSKK